MNNLPLLGCIVLTFMFAAAAHAATAPAHGKRVVGYFAQWNKEYGAIDLPADRLTHVIYAFARIRDGECALGDAEAAIERVYPGDPPDAPFHGHFRQLQLLKQKHPHLRTLVSIGGWGGSDAFSDVALAEASRETFARSCVAFASKYGFDGVDIDWEFPGSGGKDPTQARAEDTPNFTLLLEALRRALDAQGKADGKHYALTIAAPAGPNYRNIELDRIHRHLDFINLMTYDFAGPWSKVTAFNAPLFAPEAPSATQPAPPARLSADAAVRAYLDAGVPRNKLVIGVPFYGRAFDDVPAENNGLFQPHAGEPPKPAGGGHWTYRTLVRHYLDGQTMRRFWHEQAKVPWLYDRQAKIFVTYDDPESLRIKARYIRDHDLGGVMIWELSQDDEKSSLLNALHEGLSRR